MRLLITSQDYRPNVGGIATYIYHLALELSKQGHSVMLVVANRGNSPLDDCGHPFQVKRIPMSVLWTPYWTICLLYYILIFRAQVVINGEWKAGVHTWLLHHILPIRYFTIAHGSELLETDYTWKKRIWKRFRSVKKAVFQFSSAVFPNSANTVALLEKLGVDKRRLKIVHPAVDPKEFYPAAKPIDLIDRYRVQNCKIILSVSRLTLHKGHDIVIRALPDIVSCMERVKYLIVGCGPSRTYLEKLAKELNIGQYLVFAGYVEAQKLRDYYNLADVFVQLSRETRKPAAIEGFGISFIEANACGKPVVGGLSGGVPDAVLHGRTGLLIDPISPEACAEALKELLLNPKLAHRMGTEGRRRIEQELNWMMTTRHILSKVVKADSPVLPHSLFS